MGVCLDKDVGVKDSLSVSSMPPPPPPPTSSGRAGGGKAAGASNKSFVKPAAAAVMATKELKKQISGMTSSAENKKRKWKNKNKEVVAATAASEPEERGDGAGEDGDAQLSNGAGEEGGGELSLATTAAPFDDGDDDTAGTLLPASGLGGGEEHDSITLRSGVGSGHQLVSEGEVPGSASRRSLMERAEVTSLLLVAAEPDPGGRSPQRSVSRSQYDNWRAFKASHTVMSRFPELTKPAPEFTGQAVVNGQFKQISLSDYKGKYVVLFFYPLDFTFVCPTEIISFSEKAEDFRKIGCEVIACSTDSQFSHFAWINTSRKMGGLGPMNIPLLADKTGQIARDYGCYKEDEGIAFRGLYIIDDKGRLRQITINDLPVGRSVDETLRLVQAFQYTDVHGEVCPANWKPGDATMKPDTHGSKEYFEKH